MKKGLLVLLTIFSLVYCEKKKKDNKVDDLLVLSAFQPLTYTIAANITNGSAVSNSMVYFSNASPVSVSAQSKTTYSTRATTSVVSGSAFVTSARTDTNGNIIFTLSVGEYSAVITTTDNKSLAFKIKIEMSDAFNTNKDGKATITYADGAVKILIFSVTGSKTHPPKPFTFVCGYNPIGDTAPPELVSAELSSSTLDISSGSGTIKIKANLIEGDEGGEVAKKASGIKTVTAKLFSPKRIAGSGYTAYANLTLNSITGLYEGDVTLSNYVENGLWKLGSISARDNSGNERTFIFDTAVSDKNYSINGCGQKIDTKISAPDFTVSGSSPDTGVPTINTATLVLSSNITGGAAQDPIATNIDVSTSTATPKEVTITITVNAVDTGGTGIASGVSYIDARLQSFSWWNSSSNYLGNAIYVRLNKTTGTNMNGTYTGTAIIRSFAEGNTVGDGQWKLGGIWINDKVGNGQFYDSTTLNKSFTIINASTTATADFYAPELKSISTDKTNVGFDENFTVSLDVTDISTEATSTDQTSNTATITTNSSSTAISGVKSVKAWIYSPLKLLDDTLGASKSITLTLNATTGKYEGSSSFLSTNNEEGGTWKVAWIEVVDLAGNTRIYKLTEGFNYYTYIKLSRVSGDITGSSIVTTIVPAGVTRN